VLYLLQKIDEAIESTVAQVACNFREVFPKLAPKGEGGACRAVRQEG
jgi:chromosome segregation ATPase